ncbi:hypothetical protein [Micromonospora sp. L32]|uniref:hypothetical protein n=1 Tax=Micromonospora TaxID=1873 RepID=UPI003F8B84D9
MTSVLAFLVYQLQRRDRTFELAQERVRQEQETRGREQRDEMRVKEERERELRGIRRERHREDFQMASQALNAIAEILDELEDGALNDELTHVESLRAAARNLESVNSRIESLAVLGTLASQAVLLAILATRMPRDDSFAQAAGEAAAGQGSALHNLVHRMINLSMTQSRLGAQMAEKVKECRRALAKEWGE